MILKLGSNGEDVKKIQNKLIELGFMIDKPNVIVADGIFGKVTEKAVVDFQKTNKLKADGIVGDKTWGVLFNTKKEDNLKIQPNQEDNIIFKKESIFPKEGIDLILEFEVGGGESYYNKYLKHPTWPGYQSGVTIGVGWDLGYNSKMSFDNDWQMLSSEIKQRLYPFIGKKGSSVKNLISGIKDIVIPWNIAYDVFLESTLPKWHNKTINAYEGLERLPKNAQAALTSLVFNRGDLIDGSDRRKEMRVIKTLVKAEDLQGIADQLRIMKRHWVGTDVEHGINRRREAEAKLIESCIK